MAFGDALSTAVPDTEPATLVQMSIKRLKDLATRLNIQFAPKCNRPTLANKIGPVLQQEQECLFCLGPCNPSIHMFPGMPGSPVGAGDLSSESSDEDELALTGGIPRSAISALASANNSDLPPTLPETDFVSGSLAPRSNQAQLPDAAAAIQAATYSMPGTSSADLLQPPFSAEAPLRPAAPIRQTTPVSLQSFSGTHHASLPAPAQQGLQQPGGAQAPADPMLSMLTALLSHQQHAQQQLQQQMLQQQSIQQEWFVNQQRQRDQEAQAERLRQAEEARIQREHQQALLQSVSNAAQATRISSILSTPEAAATTAQSAAQGQVRIVQVANQDMARFVGVNPVPLQQVVGSLDSVDFNKTKHKLTSGENAGSKVVVSQERWPNNCLPSAVVHTPPEKLTDLTKQQFYSGFLNKILMEMPHGVYHEPTINKLKFLAHIGKIAHNTAWIQVLQTVTSFFHGIEQAQQSWSDWKRIDEWLWHAERDLRAFPIPVPSQAPSKPRQPGQADQPAKKARLEDVQGIPFNWMRKHDICFLFNAGKCPEAADHKIASGPTMIAHICAGCLRLTKARISAHGAASCPSKPFNSSLF